MEELGRSITMIVKEVNVMGLRIAPGLKVSLIASIVVFLLLLSIPGPPIYQARTQTLNVEWTQMPSPPAGGVWSITIAPANPEILYAATRDANVWKSIDGGQTWEQLGERGFGAHIFANIAVHPRDPEVVYVSNGLLFKSTDGGKTWRSLGIGSGESMGVVSIALAPSNPQIIYAGDDLGRVFKSSNGGLSWRTFPVTQAPITELAVDFTDPDVVFAGTGPIGIFKTTDGGRSWTRVFSQPISSYPQERRTLVMDPTDPEHLYVGTDSGIYESRDGGLRWQRLSTTVRDPLGLVISSSRTLYAAVVGRGVLNSTDGGRTWQPTGYQSARWGSDPHLAAHPADPDVVYAGSMKGFAKSTDGGRTWTAINEGFVVDDFFTLALDPIDPDIIYAGLFWTMGMYKSRDGGRSWTWLPEYMHSEGGHEHYPMQISIDPRNPQIVYVTGAYGLRKTRDGGRTWRDVRGPFFGYHVHGLALNPTASDVLYVGSAPGESSLPGSHLYRSIDGGRTWVELNQPLRGRDVNFYRIVVAPSDPRVIYVAVNSHAFVLPHQHPGRGGVLKSTDGGQTWVLLKDGLRNPEVFALAVDPRNAEITFAGTDEGVYKTIDGGRNWQRLEGLPSGAVHDIALHPTDPDTIAVAYGENQCGGCWTSPSGRGIYLSRDGGESWIWVTQGFSRRQQVVLDVVFSPQGVLYAGTDDGFFKGILREEGR